MTQIDPWDIPHPSQRGAGQPIIPRTPPPQTPGEQEHQRLSNEALRLSNEAAQQHLDPATIDMLAHQYILAGPEALRSLGGMGRAAAANRMAVLNRATQIAGVRPGEDVQVGFARYKNGVHTLGTLESQLGTISTNENTALLNGQQYLDAIRRVYPSNSTRPGNIARATYRSVMNDPDYTTYETARNTFLTEYAKVVAGTPAGGGTLSDSARQEQQDVLHDTTSPEAAAAALEQMQRDMRNRILAFQGNIQRGYTNLSAGRSVNFAPNGDMLDEHGGVIPFSHNRDDAGTRPPTLGGGDRGGMPPGPSGGGRLDTHQQQAMPRGPDSAQLDTGSLYDSQPDPALAGINAHVAGMLQHGAPDAEIRQYISDRGVPVTQIPNFNAVLQFRRDHPGYRGAYDVQLDQHLVPRSATRFITSTLADSAPGAYATAAGNMITGQELPNIVGALGGDSELARVGIEQVRDRHPLASIAGDVSGGAMLYAGGARGVDAGLAATERAAPSLFARAPNWVTSGERATGTLAPRAIAGDAALGAYESPDNRLGGAAVAAGAGAGARGVFNTAGRAISPSGGDLAPAYEEGVQPTLGQRMGGAGNRIEQAFQSVPIVGGIQRGARSAAQDQWQLGGFNRALRNLPGDVQLPAGTEVGTAPHDFSQRSFDRAYDRVHQRIHVVSDEQLQQDLTDIRQNATVLSDPSVSHFNRVLENSFIRRLENNGGELSGSDLQAALSEVRRTARSLRSNPTGDRELAHTLDDLSQAIHDNAARHSPPEAIETLGKINRGYGMLVRIENAANRAGQGDPGEYTAKGLMNAERQQGGLRGRSFLAGNGLMTNYAKAGLRLGQTVGDSGTGERLLATGGALGMGALPHFAGTAGILPAAIYGIDTLATMPGARNAVNWALKPNRASIRPLTDELRAQLQNRAYLGSALGGPSIVAAYGNR